MSSRKEKSSDETNGSGETHLTTPLMAEAKLLPRLVPPSKQEAENYYHGILSKPRLVGRSSAGIVRWEVPAFDDEYSIDAGYAYGFAKRVIAPVGEHKIHTHHKAILPKIIKAVSHLPWTSVDTVRLGYNTVPVNDRPVVVWVGVQDARLPWLVVAEALRAVRCILDAAGLPDVECEIRHAQVLFLGGPPLFEPIVGSGRLGREAEDKVPLSTGIGQPISSVDRQFTEGTLGVYVCTAKTANPRIWALTCRHVALPLEHYKNEMYNQLHDDCQGQEMVLPSFSARQNLIYRVSIDAKSHQKELERGTHTDFYEMSLAYLNELRAFLDAIAPLDQRTFGRLCLAPPISYAKGKHPWLRDWALIALDPTKFLPERTRNVADLRSKEHNLEDLPELLALHNTSHYPMKSRDGFLPLVGTIPVAELEQISRADFTERYPIADEKEYGHESEDGYLTKPETPRFDSYGNRCLIVGKRGAVTGMTWGVSNDLESVIRQFNEDGYPGFTSRVWAVCGSLNSTTTPFSKKGDSGAAVFDVTGRVLGQLIAGSGSCAEVNMTYVTPMEFLLQDISAVLGEPVRLL